MKCFIVNVYSPCDLVGKMRLWADLNKVKTGFIAGLWYFVGDFNAITTTRERKGIGTQVASQEMIEFKNCVNILELVDSLLLGRKFTWYRADGSAMSRIDRFLLGGG